MKSPTTISWQKVDKLLAKLRYRRYSTTGEIRDPDTNVLFREFMRTPAWSKPGKTKLPAFGLLYTIVCVDTDTEPPTPLMVTAPAYFGKPRKKLSEWEYVYYTAFIAVLSAEIHEAAEHFEIQPPKSKSWIKPFNPHDEAANDRLHQVLHDHLRTQFCDVHPCPLA